MRPSPIEYIGATPKARKKQNKILKIFLFFTLITFIGAGSFYFTNSLKAAQHSIFSDKEPSPDFLYQNELVRQFLEKAFERTKIKVCYDPNYHELPYPNGDLPDDRGAAADLIIRTYRAIDLDLQQLIHTDLKENFDQYPNLFKTAQPDPNIDHRKVRNLNTFFSLNAESKLISSNPNDYAVGDIVVWELPHGALHIGIVSPHKEESPVPSVIHNIGTGPKWENRLFDYKIVGHYRYGLD